MAKIRILPEQLANQIAAGEVVERPASVVKELVENSLDAGADRIEIEIEGGGTRLIRILDNGSGMDEDDVLLSFERHGTSKINDSSDLAAINSLGFRGEAIPSIASVSKMSIISRAENSPLGTQVLFQYGKLVKVHETGCSKGTVIEVRNLFGNTPARKKFLRTTRTELSHIEEIVKNYGLGCPDTAISLRVNGKETLSFGSGQTIEQRLRSILKYDGEFIPIGTAKPSSHRNIHGLLVPPEKTLAASARLRLFINGRAIRDRLMNHAAFEGLRSFLLKGHAPAGYIHLRVPAEEVDVNVHPAKHEVRFHNSGAIHQFIKQNMGEAMQNHQRTLREQLFPVPESRDETFPSTQHREKESAEIAHPSPLLETQEKTVDFQNNAQTKASPAVQSQPYSRKLTDPHFAAPIAQTRTQEVETSPPSSQLNVQSTTAETVRPTLPSHGMRVIGQFKNLYIFCQSGDNLIVVDQHAAHERLLYEKFRKQFTQGKVASQTLMFPQSIELSPFQIQVLENNQEEIEQLGFTINEFGGNSFVINAIPAMAGGKEATEVFFDVLDGFGKEKGKRVPGGKIDNILATMACKAAIKSGHELSEREIDALLNSMAEADLFSHCPHGRPVLKSFSPDDIKKWFHRT